MNLQVRPWVAALIDLAIEHGLEVKSSCHGEFMVELVILVMMGELVVKYREARVDLFMVIEVVD
jgi:hypothetical protein